MLPWLFRWVNRMTASTPELPDPVGGAQKKKDVPIPNTALLNELKMIRLMAMNKFAFIMPVVSAVGAAVRGRQGLVDPAMTRSCGHYCYCYCHFWQGIPPFFLLITLAGTSWVAGRSGRPQKDWAWASRNADDSRDYASDYGLLSGDRESKEISVICWLNIWVVSLILLWILI